MISGAALKISLKNLNTIRIEYIIRKSKRIDLEFDKSLKSMQN